MTAYEQFVKDFQQEIVDVPLHKRDRIITPSKMRIITTLIKDGGLKERRS